MADRQRIRNEGAAAESRFISLVHGATPADRQSAGDAMLVVDGVASYVEIKQCSSSTINQVRPLKFIPCVVWLTRDGAANWLVLSPDDLVRIAAEKARGQHTELAFECMNLQVRASLLDHPGALVSDEQLDGAVRDAVRRGRAAAAHKQAMLELRAELRSLLERYQACIRALGR